jgi:hypothetical protein
MGASQTFRRSHRRIPDQMTSALYSPLRLLRAVHRAFKSCCPGWSQAVPRVTVCARFGRSHPMESSTEISRILPSIFHSIRIHNRLTRACFSSHVRRRAASCRAISLAIGRLSRCRSPRRSHYSRPQRLCSCSEDGATSGTDGLLSRRVDDRAIDAYARRRYAIKEPSGAFFDKLRARLIEAMNEDENG